MYEKYYDVVAMTTYVEDAGPSINNVQQMLCWVDTKSGLAPFNFC